MLLSYVAQNFEPPTQYVIESGETDSGQMTLRHFPNLDGEQSKLLF